MEDLVLKAVSQLNLLSCGDTVTVAFSGGADSVALLYSLYSLKDKLGITVNAAHLNHLIRGEEAMRDEAFVKSFCEKLGIELFCEQIDVPKYASDNHIGLELAARQVRYEFLNRVAKGKIATAHTASDNLETVLFNLTRGTALKGLCGIPAVRGNIIRPLIFATRQDVEDYCELNSLAFVTDSTNLSDDYSRNKLRHKVIPVLRELNPSVEQSVLRTSLSLREYDKILEKQINEILFSNLTDDALNLDFVTNTDIALSKGVIKRYFQICYSDILLENNHINDCFKICKSGKGKVNLPCDVFAVVKNGCLNFCTNNLTEKQFSVKITETEKINNLLINNSIDCDKIVGKLIVRTRMEGDSIRLLNRGCTKTLKKLFTECKIDLQKRKNLPVIADEKGVIWVYKIGVAQRVALSDNTKKAFNIDVLEI
jgi:tRNA(Ile)-lysidine synthase